MGTIGKDGEEHNRDKPNICIMVNHSLTEVDKSVKDVVIHRLNLQRIFVRVLVLLCYTR